MAWQIVKTSFRTLRNKFKRFIIFSSIAFLLLIADTFFFSEIPVLSHISYIFITVFVEIPFYIIFFEKNVFSLLLKKWLPFLVTAVISRVFFLFIQYIFSFPGANNIFLTYTDGIIVLNLIIGSLCVEIIKNDLNVSSAAVSIIKTFSRNALGNLWLLIKITLIETFSIAAFVLIILLIISFAPSPESMQLIRTIFIWLVEAVFVLFLYPYFAIRICCYYETISLCKKR